MKSKKLLEGNIYKTLIMLAVPIMLNNLLQTFYNLTDTYWLGRLNADSMAAITLVSPLQNVITSFGGGLTAGGAVILSQCFGAGDTKKSADTANQVFLILMSFSVIAGLILFAGCGAMIKGMGADGTVYEYAVLYQRIMSVDIPLIYTVNVYTSVHNSAGKTGKPLALNFIGIVINMILDPLFIVVFGWGVGGAAVATVISKIPCAVLSMYFLTRKDAQLRITPLHIKPDKCTILDIIRTGLPMGIGNSAMQFGFVLMNKNVMDYGTVAVAAYGIGNKLNGIVSTPSTAMSNAVSIISGQTKGAGMRKRGIQSMTAGMLMMVGLLAATGFVLSRNTISHAAAGIFSTDAEVINSAARFLAIMSVMTWTNGVYDSAKGYLTGQGRTLSTVTINAARLWLFRFAVLFVCESILNLGVDSIWYAVTLSNAIAAIVMGIYAIIIIRDNNTKRRFAYKPVHP